MTASKTLPPPLRGVEAGTFTEKTITVRFPDTVAALLTDNAFSPAAQKRIQALLAELPNGRLTPIRPDGGNDASLWDVIMQPHYGETWISAPWLEVEFYLYRRILSATGYFSHGDGFGVDPFRGKKQQSLLDSAPQIAALATQINQTVDLGQLIQVALWGNQADLSLWQAGDANNPTHGNRDAQQAHTLADDTTAVLDLLQKAKPANQIQFINDNAGFELVTDLALADGLLQSETAVSVTFNLKAHPTFVSDATVADAHATIDFLSSRHEDQTRQFGERLSDWRKNGRLHFTTHSAWTLPLPFWSLPQSALQQVANAALLISKGDANYRRLLGDRHWPYDTPFEAIVDYLPIPLLALRTQKSEVAAGISADTIQRRFTEDPAWLTNGKWGVIQLSQNKKGVA